MNIPVIKQNFQDWLTQQWVILFGKKINKDQYVWLLGPFGSTDGIGVKFIHQLAQKEKLIIDASNHHKGILTSINQLNLSEEERNRLSKKVIDFYEKTDNYDFDLTVKWNPFFKGFGVLLKVLFSNRIEQLNIPIENIKDSRELKSEIIHLLDSKTNKIKRTIWLRRFKNTNQVVYSGIYESCKIPSGKTCITAIFPLPNGNATVILSPSVGESGELILKSAGKKIGESGFYFLLKDSNGNLWTKFIKSFRDELVVAYIKDKIMAKQTFTLWNLKVLSFEYSIKKQQY